MEDILYFEDFALNEVEIRKYCKKLGYSYSMHQKNKVAIIETGLDSWKLTAKQFINNYKLVNRIEVKHYNRNKNKTGKVIYHFQTYADTIEYAFMNVIKTHNHATNILSSITSLKNTLDDLDKPKYA